MVTIPYGRRDAVAYAHQWAFKRNPAFYDYEHLGGDCTNFASQCLYAGCHVMNVTPVWGWYYTDANRKAPAWTGVGFFAQFLLRAEATAGPFAAAAALEQCQPGDFVQLLVGGRYTHTPIIVAMGAPATAENTLVAAHSYDADRRPLSSYQVEGFRFLHILGARR